MGAFSAYDPYYGKNICAEDVEPVIRPRIRQITV